MCRLISLQSILYYASLNSHACFVCARPNSWVYIQTPVEGIAVVICVCCR